METESKFIDACSILKTVIPDNYQIMLERLATLHSEELILIKKHLYTTDQLREAQLQSFKAARYIKGEHVFGITPLFPSSPEDLKYQTPEDYLNRNNG